MITPDALLESRLGDMRMLTVRDEEIDLLAEVRIPQRADLEQTLHDHVERDAMWRVLRAKSAAKYARLVDELDELKNRSFRHFWQALEEQERAELAQCVTDEDAPRDPFRRKQTVDRSVARGAPRNMGRWRRNFSDDYVWSYVWTEETVLAAKVAVRDAKKRLDVLTAVVDAMEHRMRCISHLCARDREARA